MTAATRQKQHLTFWVSSQQPKCTDSWLCSAMSAYFGDCFYEVLGLTPPTAVASPPSSLLHRPCVLPAHHPLSPLIHVCHACNRGLTHHKYWHKTIRPGLIERLKRDTEKEKRERESERAKEGEGDGGRKRANETERERERYWRHHTTHYELLKDESEAESFSSHHPDGV